MKNQLFFFLVILGAGLWGCTAQVSGKFTNTDKVRSYKTYALAEGEQKSENPLYNSDQIDQEIRSNLQKELEVRGFVQDTIRPDFLVRYQTYTEKVRDVQPGYFYPGFGWGGMFGRYMSRPSVTVSTQGVLVIDVIDRKSGKTVWRGFAEGNVDNVKKVVPKASKAVQGIMKKFPVKPKTKAEKGKEGDDLYL